MLSKLISLGKKIKNLKNKHNNELSSKNKNILINKKKKKLFLYLNNVSFNYKDEEILENISFFVKQNSFVTILGPSGCGKTTLLKIISGHLKPTNGNIYYKNKLYEKTKKKNIKTIFQHLGLFPHLNVYENIEFGLKIRHEKKDEISKKVNDILKILKIENIKNKRIDEISGGQKQRVAFARSLILKPDILLLDEPFSNLDKNIKIRLEKELKQIQKKTKTTFILTTHNQEEALLLSDFLIILNKKRIVQKNTPVNIYNEPINKWIAGFIGSGNIITNATFIKNYIIKWDSQIFSCIDYGFEYNSLVDVIIRPEDIIIVKENYGFFNGKVINIIFKGVHWNIKIKANNRNYLVCTTKHYSINKNVGIKWAVDAIHVMKVQ